MRWRARSWFPSLLVSERTTARWRALAARRGSGSARRGAGAAREGEEARALAGAGPPGVDGEEHVVEAPRRMGAGGEEAGEDAPGRGARAAVGQLAVEQEQPLRDGAVEAVGLGHLVVAEHEPVLAERGLETLAGHRLRARG